MARAQRCPVHEYKLQTLSSNKTTAQWSWTPMGMVGGETKMWRAEPTCLPQVEGDEEDFRIASFSSVGQPGGRKILISVTHQYAIFYQALWLLAALK